MSCAPLPSSSADGTTVNAPRPHHRDEGHIGPEETTPTAARAVRARSACSPMTPCHVVPPWSARSAVQVMCGGSTRARCRRAVARGVRPDGRGVHGDVDVAVRRDRAVDGGRAGEAGQVDGVDADAPGGRHPAVARAEAGRPQLGRSTAAVTSFDHGLVPQPPVLSARPVCEGFTCRNRPRARPKHKPQATDLGLEKERVTRIELALSAWEADVLPLNYTRVTHWPKSRCPNARPLYQTAGSRCSRRGA